LAFESPFRGKRASQRIGFFLLLYCIVPWAFAPLFVRPNHETLNSFDEASILSIAGDRDRPAHAWHRFKSQDLDVYVCDFQSLTDEIEYFQIRVRFAALARSVIREVLADSPFQVALECRASVIPCERATVDKAT